MKPRKKIIYVLAFLFLVCLSLFIWNNYQLQVTNRPDKPIKLPLQISGKCGMENCHGLDISCGSNVAQICDEMFMVGDQCRQYVGCQTINGQCQLVTTQKFTDCKNCIEKCENLYKDDGVNLFECSSKCSE